MNEDSPFVTTASPLIPDHESLRLIGCGSYGEVWLARSVLGTLRAVKVVRRSSFRDSRPFEREFTGIRKFEPVARASDSLVHIFQVGRNEAEDYFYYVMELADDAFQTPHQSEINPKLYVPRTLCRERERLGKLPARECLQYGLVLTLGLDHLHKNGLIHRDIKPSNIIFVKGVPKLADIGLVADLGEAHSYVGTEGFIPPEGPNSQQADIYSLGKVLYEVAMGKDRHDFPEPCSDLVENPDRRLLIELNAVILKACDPDLSRRYSSAWQMHQDLLLLHSGKSVREKRATVRRFKVMAGVAAASVLVTLTGFMVDRVLGWRVLALQGQSSGINRELLGRIPERAPTAPGNTIDLSAYYTASLIERWHPGPEANTLKSLPRGIQTIAGTVFDVRGLVQLSGQEIRSYGAVSYPESIQPISVGRWVKRLHFLQGAISEVADDKRIGHYEIQYASGRKIEIPIIYGRHLRALWQPGDFSGTVPNSTLAWTGQNAAASERSMVLRLYKHTWENPWPEDEILDLRFQASGANSAPFMVALTCDEHEPASLDQQLPSSLVKLLQERARAMERIMPAGSDSPLAGFTKLHLNQKPLELGGRFYDGFRFKTPPGAAMDLVWAYRSSTNLHARGWYILPIEGSLKIGFEDWYHGLADPLPGASTTPDLAIQFLSAKKLAPNRDYFIWFVFNDSQPSVLHSTLRFVPPGDMNPNDPQTLFRSLRLQKDSAPGRVNFHRHYCLGAIR